LVLISSFDAKYQELLKRTNMLTSALRAIEQVKHFPVLLKIILHFGNFLNHGSSRGAANGFKLSSLQALSQMKSVSSNLSYKTLLHVFSSYLGENFPEVENGFLLELADVTAVSNETLNDLGNSICVLAQQIRSGEQIVNELQNENEMKKQTDLVATFLGTSIAKLSCLKDSCDKATETLGALAKFYGFTTREISEMNFDEFFGYFSQFCQSYRQVKKEILLLHKRQEAAAKRDQSAKERKEFLLRKKEEKLLQKQQNEEKMVDNLFEDLCGGNFKRTPRRRRTSRIPIPSKQVASDYMKEEIMDIWNTCVQKKRRRTKTPIHLTPIA